MPELDFNSKKGFICDMDGVIYHGNIVLPGVAEFINWLNTEKKEYLFLTNNSGYTPCELKLRLARLGLDVPEHHFYTSALATAAFLKEQSPGCSVYVIGEESYHKLIGHNESSQRQQTHLRLIEALRALFNKALCEELEKLHIDGDLRCVGLILSGCIRAKTDSVAVIIER